MGEATRLGMKPPDSFPFFYEDFINGTSYMSPEEVGIYVRLLCYQWAKGGVPSDEEMLFRIAGLQQASNKLATSITKGKFLKDSDGILRNQRLAQIRDKAFNQRRKMSERGKKGAKARHLARSNKLATSQQQASNKLATSQQQASNKLVTNNSPHIYNSTKGKVETIETIETTETAEYKVLSGFNEALTKLGLKSNFRMTPGRKEAISDRLEEIDEDSVGAIQAVSRMIKVWKGGEYEQFLTPDTLFKPDKFMKYYEQRDMPVRASGKSEEVELKEELKRYDAKVLNKDGTFQCDHRGSDGELKSDIQKRRKEIIRRLRELGVK